MTRTRKTLIFLAILVAIIALLCVIFWPDLYMWANQKASDWQDGESASIRYIDRDFQFPAGMPPDPGEAGRKTIDGIDSDGDGVRDDLQRWVYAVFPNDPDKQMAFRQWARYFQNGLKRNLDCKEARSRENSDFYRAQDCEQSVFRREDSAHYKWRYLRAKAFNTYARTKLHYEKEALFSYAEIVASRPPKEESPCDNR